MESFELTLDARPESLSVVRHVLGALPASWTVDAETLDDVLVAVNEACSNVVVHAYPGQDGLMEVHGKVDGARLHVAVTDRGEGIERDGGDDHGVGLDLIETLADRVVIERLPDGRHEVRMTFVSSDG